MKSFKIIFRAALLGLFLLISVWLILLVRGTGLLRPLTETGNTVCRVLGDVIGPEDFAIDRDWGLMWITQADRFGVEEEGISPKGAIFVLDLADPEAIPRMVPSLEPDRFFPHGLGLWHDQETGERRLFVVDHGPDYQTHAIQMFQAYEDGTLTHLETISHPLMTRPNDVAPVGPRQFFATNDLGGLTSALRAVEPYLLAPWSNLVFFDGADARYAVRGLRYGNGVITNADTSRLYLAQVLGKSVTAYALGTDYALKKLWRADVGMGVDNLTLTAAGDILAAGHPRPLEFTKHARDLTHPSTSEVVKLSLSAGSSTTDTVFLDRGTLYSGASVAQIHGNRLFIGSVYGRGLLACQIG